RSIGRSFGRIILHSFQTSFPKRSEVQSILIVDARSNPGNHGSRIVDRSRQRWIKVLIARGSWGPGYRILSRGYEWSIHEHVCTLPIIPCQLSVDKVDHSSLFCSGTSAVGWNDRLNYRFQQGLLVDAESKEACYGLELILQICQLHVRIIQLGLHG